MLMPDKFRNYYRGTPIAIAGLLAGVIVAVVGASLANQSNTWTPTTGKVSGLQLSTNINNAFSAIQSCNSGAVAPTNDQTGAAVQGQCWLNTSTTPFTVQQWDGAVWTTLGWMDAVNHQWIPNIAGGVGSVASATTTDLCATGGVLTPNAGVTVSGNATINGLGSTCLGGAVKLVVFSGTPTLVHNATSFILPNGGFNISVSPGDSMVAVALGAGNWRVVSYQQASGLGGIPSGTELPFAGISPPSGFTLEAGQALNRASNPTLFSAITLSITGTPGNGSPTINSVSVDLRNLGVEGAILEGTGIPVGAFISSVTASTITMNTNATGGSGAEPIRLLPWGQGDGVTTFNVPDRRGVVLAGRDNMLGTAAGRLSLAQSQGILGTKLGGGVAGGNIGGEQSHTQLLAEIASHTHSITDPGHAHNLRGNSAQDNAGARGLSQTGLGDMSIGANANTFVGYTNTTSGGGGFQYVQTSTVGFSATNSSGSGTAMNQVQPTAIANYMIKN